MGSHMTLHKHQPSFLPINLDNMTDVCFHLRSIPAYSEPLLPKRRGTSVNNGFIQQYSYRQSKFASRTQASSSYMIVPALGYKAPSFFSPRGTHCFQYRTFQCRRY